MNAEQFIASGGRIFHRKERNRTVTVAYQRHGGSVSYGATIHNQTSTKDQWNRKHHIQTAIARFLRDPVLVEDKTESSHERKRLLRAALIRHGVSGASNRKLLTQEAAHIGVDDAFSLDTGVSTWSD